MSHFEQQEFCQSVKNKHPSFFKNNFVLDIGCLDINGNNHYLFDGCNYLGLDVAEGDNVDIITPGHKLGMPDDSFDTIISTECFEHDQFYVQTIKNIYRMLKPGGLFLFTCATTGRPEHGTRRTTPHDAPLLQDKELWADYYKNLTEDDIRDIFEEDFNHLFSSYSFSTNDKTKDLYFWGVKQGDYKLRTNYSFLHNEPSLNLKLLNKQNLILDSVNELLADERKYKEEVSRIKKENENLLRKLEEKTEKNQLLLNDIQYLSQQVEMYTNSRILKITYPLRAFKSIFSKFKEKKLLSRLNKLLRLLIENPKLIGKTVVYIRKFGIQQAYKRLVSASNTKQHNGTLLNVNIKEYNEIYILTTQHCVSIANRIQSNLKKVGILSHVIFDKPEGGFKDSLHFVICPQIFSELPSLYISYQLEQSVSSRWFDDRYFSILNNSYAIFDYAEDNIKYLQDNGFYLKQLNFLPIGYDNELNNDLNQDYEYDVIFYGDINNKRRKKFLDRLSDRFNVKIVSNIFGEELYKEINKAKVVVNIHYYENALLETTRIYECLSLNKLVISEMSSDINKHCEIKECVEFTDVGDIDGMISRIEEWIDDEDKLKARIENNKKYLNNRPDYFEFYFMRFLLSQDWITFDEFYNIAGHNINFEGNFVCLGLPESVDRKADFDKDNQYSIEYFPGLRHNLGWVGCGLSYKFLLKKAKEQGFDNFIICEDDVEFYKDFDVRFHNIKNYLKTLDKESWDLFSGLIADLNKKTKVSNVEKEYNEEFVYIDKMTSTVMNIYSNEFYDKVISWNDRNHDANTNTIDRYIENWTGCKVITTSKFLVGHKEELDSTLWGFNNSTYKEMIINSQTNLNQKKDDYYKITRK
ncbi:methyltransferase domain-containing protein [Photobacterium leiognathi]|uniref:methyltransferase domain-containing protein n=1 Tax=Photobacterium leiognathi TaxID=553611 RepID=UPI0015E68F55|nr:methyltransferase domain-containing protein [Photobacterium leiognathi]